MYEYKQSDVFDFANFIGAETHEKGNELFFKYCPRCKGGGKDTDTFSINLSSGVFKCFRASCDYHGHFVELARDFEFKLEQEQTRYKKLPQKTIESKPKAIEFLESRGISADVCKKYKITKSRNFGWNCFW
jgi:twinkle protein